MAATDIALGLLLAAVVVTLIWMERDRFLLRVGSGNAATVTVPEQTYQWRLLRQSGLVPDEARTVVMGTRIVLAIAVPLLLAQAGWFGAWVLAFIPVGSVMPDAFLALVRRQRQRAIHRVLSFFLDLMLSLLQAGMTLEEAFRRAAAHGLPAEHPLAREIAQVVAEVSMGRERSGAFGALADRTGVPDLRSVAEAITIGTSRGISLESILGSQAELARAKRREEGMKRLDRANAEVLLPLILCSFPMFVALVVVPLGLQLMAGMQALARVLR